MVNYRNKSDKELKYMHKNYRGDRYEVSKELKRRGYVRDGSGWTDEEEYYNDHEPVVDSILGVKFILGVIALLVGIISIHKLVMLAWDHTIIVSFIFIFGLLVMMSGGKRSSKGTNIFFFLTTIPLAARFFPYFLGEDYINWFLMRESAIDSFDIAKYGIYLIIYLVIIGIIATVIANIIKLIFCKE